MLGRMLGTRLAETLMPRKAKSLSALEVARIKSPGLHAVGTVDGLHMLVKATGARSWILRVKVGKKRRDMGLGGFPAVPLAAAHAKAREAREAIKSGVDPILTREQAHSALIASQSAAITFDRAVELFLDAKGDEWRNSKHRAQWKATLETYASPKIGRMLVADVGSADVHSVIEPIWRSKNETASRLRGRIEAVISYAVQAGYRPQGLNPGRWRGNLDMLLPKPSKVGKGEHFPALPYSEMGRFTELLRKASGTGARAVEFLVLTAARSGEVRGATWPEFDLEAGLWTIPASRMKAEKEHRVPLSEQAINLLRSLSRLEGSDLVFPAPRGGIMSDMTLGAVVRRLHEANVKAGGAGLVDRKQAGKVVTVHGFRSAFRDWAAEASAYPTEVVEMALAHSIGNKVEAAYRRGDLFEKRRNLMSDWAEFSSAALPQADTNILAMRSDE